MTLFETLAIKNKQILNLSYHNDRFKKGQFFLNRQTIINDISTLINIPTHFNNNLIRCRVTYNKNDIKVEYFDYNPKPIHSFKLVEYDDIEYSHKYDDRRLLNDLLSQKESCDEIIIIKNSFVTDCSIGNLLFLKDDVWYTPDTPLLNGTQRAYLLSHKKIELATIKKDDIFHYEKVMMINALNPFDECRAVDIAHVIHDD